VVHGRVRSELTSALELHLARRRDEHMCSEGLRDRERRGRDAAPDAPREHPLALAQSRPCDEHPVGRLEDERKRRGLLEAQSVRNRVDVRRGHGDQLRVRAVPVLADHVDPAAADLDAGIEDDALAELQAADAVAERLDHACAVGAEDARLRHRGEPFADPDVEMVQRRGAQADEHLARPGLWIRSLLELEHLGAAVLVDPHRAHRGRLSV
jgi:hypothetical protein